MAKRATGKTRPGGLLLVAGTGVLVGAANALHVHSLEKQLHALGVERAQTLRRDGLILVNEDSVAEATAAKRFALFGATSGKVTVYLRSHSEPGHARYRMLVIFYEKSGPDWTLTESAMCSDAECKPLAKKAFDDTV